MRLALQLPANAELRRAQTPSRGAHKLRAMQKLRVKLWCVITARFGARKLGAAICANSKVRCAQIRKFANSKPRCLQTPSYGARKLHALVRANSTLWCAQTPSCDMRKLRGTVRDRASARTLSFFSCFLLFCVHFLRRFRVFVER